MDIFNPYHSEFERALKALSRDKSPQNLYDPIEYLIQMGGKRIRPFLTLLAAECFGETAKSAMQAALAVEVFHNFTLMHDDIMDRAFLRRGQETVHKKWNTNTAILSGDAMLILAYRLLEVYDEPKFRQLTRLFSKTAIEVCEGQQYDMDFETSKEVSEQDYLEMIRLKTAVLIGCALQMGAIVADASAADQRLLYDFGIELGLAFQLQDDFLDAFGDQEAFGKKIGGDILENKKTILYHLAKKGGTADQVRQMEALMGGDGDLSPQDKIAVVTALYESSGAKADTKKLVLHHSQFADLKLGQLSIDEDQKKPFRELKDWLMKRDH